MNQQVTVNTGHISIVSLHTHDSKQIDSTEQNNLQTAACGSSSRSVWRVLATAIAGVSLSLSMLGCISVPPPENVENICSIFEEKEGWYEDALASEQKWGAPPHVLMAIVRYESRFVGDARPPMKTFLGVIPLGRPTTAYGYGQAVNGTWENYLEETGNSSAERVNFHDAIDFVGWYTDVSFKKLGISKWDGYNQYLAYHEGHVGFSRQSYNKKAWLKRVAKKVHSTSELYAYQLNGCREQLELKIKPKPDPENGLEEKVARFFE